MQSVFSILVLAVPVPVVTLLLGLALIIHVLATEGRSRSRVACRVVAVANLVFTLAMVTLAALAPTGGARWMFAFVAVTLVLLGTLGLVIPRRFSDDP